MTHVAIVGAGQAGASCVARLRTKGFDGQITLIGDEPFAPYQRPPLSKAYLLGDLEPDRLLLKPISYYKDQNIDLRLGTPVNSIHPTAHQLQVGAQQLTYDALVLATGSRPRRLPSKIGGDLRGVHVIRTMSDIDRLRPNLSAGKRMLVIGGGYVGLEASAVASKLGLDVTLIEMAPRILQRVAAPETSDFFRSLHQDRGVNVIEGAGLKALLGQERVRGGQLTDGTKLEADVVIVGVGIEPETSLAEAGGIVIENGIRVDDLGRTSVADVWAAGDCASFPYQDTRIRLESVPNAIDHAECVADNILGDRRPYQAKPWFWSDQYDVKLQIAGLNTGYDRVVTRGLDQAYSVWYFQDHTLLAVDAMNDPRAYMAGKRLVEAGVSPTAAQVADPRTDLKALVSTLLAEAQA